MSVYHNMMTDEQKLEGLKSSHALLAEPAVALSVRQPWAWLIAHRYKPLENRTWPTKFRGRFLVHAGKTMTRVEYDRCFIFVTNVELVLGIRIPLPAFGTLKEECGGIVGEATITDCVFDSESPWFVGLYAFIIENAKPLPFRPCRGELGFFKMRETL